MHSDDKNFFVMVLLLGVAVLFSIFFYGTYFKQTDTVHINDFPRTVGDWDSEDIPLSKDELAILETDNAFVRKYKNTQGQEVFLYMVYSQTNHKAAHPPEICYIGGGVAILEKGHDFIPVEYKNLTIKANRLFLEDNGLYQITLYWFKVGDTFTSSYWKEQMLVAWNTLLGKRQGSALIRISADVDNNNKKIATQEIKQFINLITPRLFQYLP